MPDKIKLWIGYFLCGVWIVNFLGYMVISGYFGGYAYMGKIDRGHYYLAHGKGKTSFVEVTEQIFNYSSAHGLVTLITIPCMFACLYWIFHVQMRLRKQGCVYPLDMTGNRKAQ